MLKSRRELRTILLIVLCYALWLIALLLYGEIYSPLVFILMTTMIAFHSSLQHETLHGHPFKNQIASDALVYPAIGLLVPYIRFTATHLAHHQDSVLTDPYDDPESNYLDPEKWATLSTFAKLILNLNNTLLGRMLLGPGVSLWTFYRADWQSIKKGDRKILWAWIHHLIGSALALFVVFYADVPLWFYIPACYFGMSLLKIRTYLEHRAFEQSAGRTVIIEDKGPLSILFLNNNYHAVHHAHPKMPWYDLPEKFRQNRENYLARNRHYYYQNYFQIFKSYFLKRKDEVPHPLYPWKKD